VTIEHVTGLSQFHQHRRAQGSLHYKPRLTERGPRRVLLDLNDCSLTSCLSLNLESINLLRPSWHGIYVLARSKLCWLIRPGPSIRGCSQMLDEQSNNIAECLVRPISITRRLCQQLSLLTYRKQVVQHISWQ